MTALARIDARHLARSPLLLGGLVLGLLISGLTLFSTPTVLPFADELLYQYGGLLLGCGALLAGAWLGLRDDASGVSECLAATPTPAWRRERARLVAAVLGTAGVFAVVFAVGVAVATAMGGRGVPSARLLLDGMLVVGLSAGMGLTVGRITGSRAASLFAAVVWFLLAPGSNFAVADFRAVARLLPVVFFEQRSVVLGFLPDPFWVHPLYLAGLLTLLGVVVVAVARRGEEPRTLHPPLAATGVVALAVVAVSGAWLWTLPDALVTRGPDPAQWSPAELDDFFQLVPRAQPYAYPADDLATACAAGPDVEVCVYPAYGEALAREVVTDAQPMAALLAGLSGVPERVRMVPSSAAPCQGDEVQLPELEVRAGAVGLGSTNLLSCALGDWQVASPAGAVWHWALATVDPGYRELLEDEARVTVAQEGEGAIDEAAAQEWEAQQDATQAMLRLPPEQVVAELAPLWQRLRAGELELAELPGAGS